MLLKTTLHLGAKAQYAKLVTVSETSCSEHCSVRHVVQVVKNVI